MVTQHPDGSASFQIPTIKLPKWILDIAKAKGIGHGEILKWLADHKGDIFAVIELILAFVPK